MARKLNNENRAITRKIANNEAFARSLENGNTAPNRQSANETLAGALAKQGVIDPPSGVSDKSFAEGVQAENNFYAKRAQSNANFAMALALDGKE